MKINLSFDLPEDKEEYQHAYHGQHYIVALQEFDNFLREKVKYAPESLPPDRLDAYIEVRDHLYSLCDNFHIWT